MKISIVISIILFSLCACTSGGGGGDAPVLAPEYAKVYDNITPLGQKVRSNSYEYSADVLDSYFEETLACMNYLYFPPDIYLVLEEPLRPFPCTPSPNGCGGLFQSGNDKPIITVSADLVRLKEEYVHYILYYQLGDPDSDHLSIWFDECS